ncbi:MAG: hypothetical protein COB02_00905 [Candidatus Cloacimonadota bacterium]|nr:MAG: hypothetical protein COB02_00905 [Candidatus Cloacimonadota bacterium]
MKIKLLIHTLFLLHLFIFVSSSAIVRYIYEDEPNDGVKVIRGLALGNEFLSSFQYRVEVANEGGIDFRSGDVEVVFYNQFGQILNAAALIHQPFNATGFDDPDDGVIVFAPTLPLYEGRTQLLSWARHANSTPFTTSTTLVGGSLTFTVASTIAVGSTLQCTPPFRGLNVINQPQTAFCETTIIPAIIGFTNPTLITDTPVTLPFEVPPGSVFIIVPPAGSITTLVSTGVLHLTGALTIPGDWFFGPFVFQNGDDAGDFIFLDTDQGPPAPPHIDFFECQGTSTCVGNPLVVETPRSQLSNLEPYRFKVVFNKQDIFNVVNSGGPSLVVSYHGHVINDPTLFNGTLPGASPKPESNAFLDSELRPIRFTSTVAPEQSRKTTGTGPFPISVFGVPPLPQVTYPDQISPFPYGTAVYDDVPIPLKYPFGASLSPGRYQTISFDFSNMVDGDYEIWITAEDVTSAITQNGQSPGAIGISGDRIAGVTTVIRVIRDGRSPVLGLQILGVSFLIIGDNDEPPLPYDDFQGEIFDIIGTVSDERGDITTVDFDIIDNLGAVVLPLNLTGHFRSIRDNNGNFIERFDFTPLNPNTVGTTPPPATGGQTAFQINGHSTDPQGNISVTTASVYVIKDLQPPQDPFVVSPSLSFGSIVTKTFMDLVVRSLNVDIPSGSFDDLREHGSVRLIGVIQEAVSGGKISNFTVSAQGVGAATSDSKLDNHPLWLNNDVFGNLFDEFEYTRKINLDDFADGPMILSLSLIDQVGNVSLTTTSISFIKDTLAPTIFFNPEHRLVSGPDNNYPIPNQLGGDDEVYKISLISPEQVVDNGPGLAPTLIDPGTQDLLHIQFGAKDASLPIDRVEISGPHISDMLGVIATIGTTITSVEADIDVTNLLEGIKEVINLSPFDITNKAGIPNSVAVFRDLTPAIEPVIDEPSQGDFSSVIIVRTDKDTLDIKGHLVGKDAQILNIGGGDIFQSQIIVLSPRTATPIATGDLIPKVVRSTPINVPRQDSFFSSFPDPATEANFQLVTIDSSSNFQLTVDISNIPQSPTTPTTIWVQVIDQFHNTDPNVSVKGIEIYRLKDGLPVKKVEIIDFRGTGIDYTIFDGLGSVNDSEIATLFIALETVKFRVETIIPMVEAPNLSISQFSANGLDATLLSNVDKIDGSTIFLYEYSIRQERGQFDGKSNLLVSGGQDLFKHSVISSLIETAFFVDSLAPNLTFVSPGVIGEIIPFIFPSNGSRINTQSTTFSFALTEFTGNGTFHQSGVDLLTSTAVLQGPLAAIPDGFIDLLKVPSLLGFNFSYQINEDLDDGVFRIAMSAIDLVGNDHRFYSSFIYDDTPVSGPLISTKPSNHEITSFIPEINSKKVIQINVERQDVDISQTQLILISPAGNPLVLDSSVVVDAKNIYFPINSNIIYGGSFDGSYILSMIITDLVGNITHKKHNFLLDTKAPEAISFFPKLDSCVRDPFSLADALVQDVPGRSDLSSVIPVSGISPKSSLKLFMENPVGKLVKLKKGDEQVGANKIISIDDFGTSGRKKMAFLLGEGADLRDLDFEGKEDGKYKLELDLYDSAGNHSTTESFFFYDSQLPSIYLSSFSEGKIFIKTSSFFFELDGVIQDEGPCEFFVSEASHNNFTTIEFRLSSYDIDNDVSIGSLITLTSIRDISPIFPPDFQHLSSQASFSFSTRVEGLGVFSSPYVLLDIEVSDQAGNKLKQRKTFELVSDLKAVVNIISPPKSSLIDGLVTTYITSDFVHEIRWESGRGLKEVEIEIFRYSHSSLPFIRAKFDANLQSSGPISFASGIAIVDREEFGIRVRAIDQQNKTGDFGLIQNMIIESRSPKIVSLSLIQNGIKQNISQNKAFLTTSIFQLELEFDQKVYQVDGLLEVDITNYQKDIIIQADSEISISTNTLLYNLEIPLDRQLALPRGSLHIKIGNFKSFLNVKMLSYEQDLIGDLGPDIDVRVFANPVSDFELIAVCRFLSYINRLEPIVIKRDSLGDIISPLFRLRRNFDYSLLNIIPISGVETPNRADSFSIPLNLGRSDAGFYFLNVIYEDVLGRVIEREWEISLGKFQKSVGFILKNSQSKSTLRVDLKNVPLLEGNIFLTSRSKTKPKTIGELLYLGDLSEIGSSSSLNSLEVIYESKRLEALESKPFLSLMKRENGVLKFYKKIKNSKSGIRLELGNDYYLVQDLKAPDISGNLDEEFSFGWQDVNLEFKEFGTGIDHSSLKVSIDGYGELNSSIEGDKLYINFPKQELLNKDLKVEISDNSGQKSILKKSINILGGEGIKWAQLAPNPIFRFQDLNLRFYILGGDGDLKISIYDVSSSRVYFDKILALRGLNTYVWDLTNKKGLEISNGVYFMVLRFYQNGNTYIKKLKFAVLK